MAISANVTEEKSRGLSDLLLFNFSFSALIRAIPDKQLNLLSVYSSERNRVCDMFGRGIERIRQDQADQRIQCSRLFTETPSMETFVCS